MSAPTVNEGGAFVRGLTCQSCGHFGGELALPGKPREVKCASYGDWVRVREIRSCPRASYLPGVDEGDWT